MSDNYEAVKITDEDKERMKQKWDHFEKLGASFDFEEDIQEKSPMDSKKNEIATEMAKRKAGIGDEAINLSRDSLGFSTNNSTEPYGGSDDSTAGLIDDIVKEGLKKSKQKSRAKGSFVKQKKSTGQSTDQQTNLEFEHKAGKHTQDDTAKEREDEGVEGPNKEKTDIENMDRDKTDLDQPP